MVEAGRQDVTTGGTFGRWGLHNRRVLGRGPYPNDRKALRQRDARRDSPRRRPRVGDADQVRERHHRRWRNQIREGEDMNRRHFLRVLRAEVDKLCVRNFVTASFRSQEE
ncbi:unnamed protein product [Sphagnum balticum]